MAAAAFDSVQWCRQWTTMRGQEGGARRGNATTSQHDERTRGWCVCNLDSGGGRPFAILEDNNPRCTCRPRLVIVLLELKSSKDPHS
jgi:hypothetical protein